MARDSKIEVGAINLRIPSNKGRNYSALLTALAALKRGVKVYGDTVLAIRSFDAETGRGLISKYTEIDLDGEWFDIERFDIARDSDKQEINIPEKLRPNYSAFFFELDERLHVVAVETYSNSKSLSLRGVEKYFQSILKYPSVYNQFGRVEADLVRDFHDVRRLLDLPNIKEIRFVIRRPNPDDIDEALAKVIEERLSGQNADEYTEIVKSASPTGGIEPNERSKRLAGVAAENGKLEVLNIENGVPVPHGSDRKPLVDGEKYQPDHIGSMQGLFSKISQRIFGVIRQNRQNNA